MHVLVILAVDGQARSIVEDAQAGLYVEPENSKAMTDAILQLAANPDLRSQLGRNGRDYIINKFSRKQTAAAYVKVLEEAFEIRNTRSPTTLLIKADTRLLQGRLS